MLGYTGGDCACFEHSNLFKVYVPVAARHSVKSIEGQGRRVNGYRGRQCTAKTSGGPSVRHRDPTTSFLTATTLIYAIGAGITAAAGTRLALQ